MSRFGKFVLVEKLAQGGMAEVFRAVLTGPKSFVKTVALKRMLPLFDGVSELRDRFIAEARVASDLNHPNIVTVYEFGEQEGTYYIASELVEGMDCAKLLSRVRSSGSPLLEAAAFIAAEAARGLAHAHSATQEGRALQLVHRDVSPQNILVSYSGDVKITDFGIAKVKTAYQKQTGAGLMMGKLRYLSPEQVAGLPLDGRSDLFALGLVLWELLVGRPLMSGNCAGDVVEQIRVGAFPPPSTMRDGVPPEFDRIVARALNRDRSRRYQNGDEMARDLDRLLKARGGFGRSDLAALLERLAPKGEKPASSTPRSQNVTPVVLSPVTFGEIAPQPGQEVTVPLQDKLLAALTPGPADEPILLERKRRRLPRWLWASPPAVVVLALTGLSSDGRSARSQSDVSDPISSAAPPSAPPPPPRVTVTPPPPVRVIEELAPAPVVVVPAPAPRPPRPVVAVNPEAMKRAREGDRLLAAGDAPGAVNLYRQALAIDRRAAAAHLGLGKSAALLGDTVLAVASFRAYLALHPDGPEASAARRWLSSLTSR